MVRVQGADASLRSNGSYDEVSLGAMSALRLSGVLDTLRPQPSPPPGMEDGCPMNVLVEGPAGLLCLAPGDGSIVTEAGAGPYSPQDAARGSTEPQRRASLRRSRLPSSETSAREVPCAAP